MGGPDGGGGETDHKDFLLKSAANGRDGAVTLESAIQLGRLVTVRGQMLDLVQHDIMDAATADQVSFVLREGLAEGAGSLERGWVSLESCSMPGAYIRHQGYRLKVHPKDELNGLYRRDATFDMHIAPDLSTTVGFKLCEDNLVRVAAPLKLQSLRPPSTEALQNRAPLWPKDEPTEVAFGWLDVPTGQHGLKPSGGASWHGYDMRSGNPHQCNNLLLKHGYICAKGGRLTGVRFAYRYVVGYSGNPGSGAPSPYFELRCAEHVLYKSPGFEARPYHWDRGEGGDPKNYSAPIHVNVSGFEILIDHPVQLQIVCHNGGRNFHLQGAAGEGCNLDMQVEIQGGIIVTLHVEPQDAKIALVACHSVGGAEVASLCVDIGIETIWTLRKKIADEMKVSMHEIRLTTSDGNLLESSHDSMLVNSLVSNNSPAIESNEPGRVT
eukprot:TRINITY_DN6669_c0_g1_i3.p1 TRINITY_DN6669_c0_g1~~TRINITY_DN6669_c0_g1_i3.p1  ORF type:complete len:499 (+),score=53.24 TRINITY_DN6669_c0_g1_i3:186-1499(+)